MEKTIVIGEKPVPFKASALIPRLYRFKFGRDMIHDMNQLKNSFMKVQKQAEKEGLTEEEQEDAQLSIMDLTIFEDVAYMMAKHADPSVPSTIEEWIDQFPMFSIYEILPQLLELWELSKTQTAKSKNQ